MRTPRCLLLSLMAGTILAAPPSEWISLFDGRTLTGWKEAPYTSRGQVSVKERAMILGKGRTTGVALAGDFPKSGYEVRFEAVRLEGNDFFAGGTFPVGDSFCFWVNGGWGGSVVGLSNLEGNDASENDTSTNRDFEKGRWYRFRLMVNATRIQAWIDEELVIDVDYTKRKVELQFDETDLGKPLGISAYGGTLAGLRKIEYRRLPE